MLKYVGDGHIITVPAPIGGADAGEIVMINGLFGIAVNTAPEGEKVALNTVGVWRFQKKTGEDWEIGEPVFWDYQSRICTTSSKNFNPMIGLATEAAGKNDKTGVVRLHGSAFAQPYRKVLDSGRATEE